MKLLVFDVEGTLFKTEIRLSGTLLDSTIWQSIAYSLGPKAIQEEVKTHRKWENGRYKNYMEWMKDTILIHQQYGLKRSLFQKLINSAEYNPGVVQTILKIDRSSYELVLISGGFRELAERAQRDLKISHAFAACEYFFGSDGRLKSYNLLPCDFKGKIDFINLMLREYRLGHRDWVFIGDGGNDVPIAKEAPLSIGYQADAQLRKVVTHTIDDFRDLLNLLNKRQ